MLDNSKDFLVSVLSTQTGDLADTIKQLTQKYVQLWWQSPASLPVFFKTYSPNEQKKIEKEISQVVEKLLFPYHGSSGKKQGIILELVIDNFFPVNES